MKKLFAVLAVGLLSLATSVMAEVHMDYGGFGAEPFALADIEPKHAKNPTITTYRS